MRRVGPKGSGAFERISWDDAIAEITGRWRGIIAQHGAQCILPYSYAGTLGLVNGAVTDSRFWNRLGACRLEPAICGHAPEEAVSLAIGRPFAPSPEIPASSQQGLTRPAHSARTAPHPNPHSPQAC